MQAGKTLLHIASENGQLSVVNFLLSKGFDANEKSKVFKSYFKVFRNDVQVNKQIKI